MDRTPLQYLVSGRDQGGFVSLGRATTAAAARATLPNTSPPTRSGRDSGFLRTALA